MASYDHVNEPPLMMHYVGLCMYKQYVKPLPVSGGILISPSCCKTHKRYKT